MRRWTPFLLLFALACATAKPVPTAALPPDPATLPPLPRSSLAVLLDHKTELELTDEQARLIQRLDDHLAEEDDALKAEVAKEPPPEPRKPEETTPDRSVIDDTSTTSPMGMGMGGGRHHQEPARPKPVATKPVPADKTLEQTLDDNDTDAFENAERSVLKKEQVERAREIATKFRADLYDRREMARKRREAGLK